jgi:hypothetical protein
LRQVCIAPGGLATLARLARGGLCSTPSPGAAPRLTRYALPAGRSACPARLFWSRDAWCVSRLWDERHENAEARRPPRDTPDAEVPPAKVAHITNVSTLLSPILRRRRWGALLKTAGVGSLDVRLRKGGTDDVTVRRTDYLLLIHSCSPCGQGGVVAVSGVRVGGASPAKVARVANLPAWRMSPPCPGGRPLGRRAPAACSPGGVRCRRTVGMGSGIVPLAACPRTSCFLLPAICAIKGTKGAPVPGPSPARLWERWRVSHDL